MTLKSEAQSNNGFAFIEVARRFFDLPETSLISDLDLLYQEQGSNSEQDGLGGEFSEIVESDPTSEKEEPYKES